MRGTAVLSLLVSSAGALRRLDLTPSSGEAAGQYVFPNGEPEATCKACFAVMEHVEREMSKPYYDEYYGCVWPWRP